MQIANIFSSISPNSNNSGQKNTGNQFTIPCTSADDSVAIELPTEISNASIQAITLSALSKISAQNSGNLLPNDLTFSDFAEMLQSFLSENSESLGLSINDLNQIKCSLDNLAYDLSQFNLTISDITEEAKNIIANLSQSYSFNSIEELPTKEVKKSVLQFISQIKNAYTSEPSINVGREPVSSTPTNIQPKTDDFAALKSSVNKNDATDLPSVNIKNTSGNTLQALNLSGSTGNSLNNGSQQFALLFLDNLKQADRDADKISFEKVLQNTLESRAAPNTEVDKRMSSAILNQLAANFKKDGQKVIIELAPRSLGDIEISFENDGTKVKSVIKADNPLTLELLRNDKNQLSQILKENNNDSDVDLQFEDGRENNQNGNSNKRESPSGNSDEDLTFSDLQSDTLQVITNNNIDITT